jgi:hypothetical protein
MHPMHGILSEAVHLTFLALHLRHATEALLRGRIIVRRCAESVLSVIFKSWSPQQPGEFCESRFKVRTRI